MSQGLNYKERSSLDASDYLYGRGGPADDGIFDTSTIVDLSVDLGIGADCGRLNVHSTLKASLNNILDEKYFESLGQNILGASPMLLTCYMSPTWCSILKHSRLRAGAQLKARLSQCGMIDKYVDSRTEEFDKARQSCVRKKIGSSGGELESAMEGCQDIWNRDLMDWAGSGVEKAKNKMIEGSAKWAGADSSEATRVRKLLTSLVGETEVERGKVSVVYGPEGKPETPRTYLRKLEGSTLDSLCGDLLPKALASIESVSEAEIEQFNLGADRVMVDRQTLSALASLPSNKRPLACRKLAESVAVSRFTDDMAKSLDFMTAMVARNPNLPDNRRKEAEVKRAALKDQIELTLMMSRYKNEPLNEVLAKINVDADRHRKLGARRVLSHDKASRDNSSTDEAIFDCSDNIFCH